jgi:ectoine hydroxylase-related dioxygenase (phytanoyl-CoA dioxygenase family)
MVSSVFRRLSLRGAVRRLRARFAIFNYALEQMEFSMEWARLVHGALVHQLTGQTPNRAHLALVNLFTRSSGRANDSLARMLSVLHPPYHFPRRSGVLGNLDDKDFTRIQAQLEADGYYIFEGCLSDKFCENIIQQSLEADCLVLGDEMASRPEKMHARYNRNAYEAAKYLLTEDDTTDIPEVQQLLCDESLIQVAQNYLRAKPIFTGLSLWWSAPYKDKPDAEAAQQFHFDMERIRWLRYFIYLTDVTSESGPHCFVKGSHRTGAIPEDLLKQGYVRQEDETILREYGSGAQREFTGRRGTIIAEDSRGFHKGAAPKKGDRLLLAFELSSSTFGANKRHFIRNIHVPQFAEFARKYPRLYSNFDFRKGLL